ncbi:MAG: amino acid adenylation domain-containing protein, partial [Acidobacteria bacterium]|nr:amino acid adenylation domain-containing protein [Acidobacteriota bacterium]
MKEYYQGRHSIDANQRLKEKEYWLGKLSGELLKSFFPYDHPAKDSGAARHMDIVNFQCGGDCFTRLMQLSNNSAVRLHIILMAVLVGLLDKYTANKDIITGAPIKKQEMEGEFLNTVLILRNQLQEEMTFKEMLLQLSQVIAEAHENINYPLETLLYQLGIAYSGLQDDFPLFNTALLLTGLQDKKYLQHLNLDTVFSFSRREPFIEGEVEYNSARYEKATIEAIVSHYSRYLDTALADINIQLRDIDILGEKEKKQLLFDFNDTGAGYPENKTIHELFEEQVSKAPDHIALVGADLRVCPYPNVSLTYLQLNEKSNCLAGLLIEKGTVPDTIIALLIEPSIRMIIGILGILKAGAAYLPIDPEYPQERIDYMLKDSGTRILITDNENKKTDNCQCSIVNCQLSTNMPQRGLKGCPRRGLQHSSHLAYVIYTSGTTGRPKGVMITHQNVVRLMMNDHFLFDFCQTDVWTLFHSYCFDFSVWEMYGALLYGGKLIVIPVTIRRDPGIFLEILAKEHVTVLNQTPSGFSNLIAGELGRREKRLRLKNIIFGGEALNPRILNEWQEKYSHTRYINMYGITETTVHVTYKEITHHEIAANSASIGKPIPTLSIYIMNSTGQLLPIGAPGEICVGGDGVARGYLNRPELTTEKFIVPLATRGSFEKPPQDPPKLLFIHHLPLTTHQSPVYRTGDLARWTRNGELEYLGRIDNQVKIRGHRIELGELENQLLHFAPVKDAAVVVRGDNSNEKQLIAYVVPHPDYCFPICRLLTMERQGFLKNKPYYDLPNRMPVFFLNRGETDFMYREIFAERSYLQHGIVLEDDACIFDVGANIGLFSLFVNSECRNAQIYAFEPLPPIFEVLSLNTTIYKGNFHIFPHGLADSDGEAIFTYYPHAAVLSGRFADRGQEIKNVEAFMLNQSAGGGEQRAAVISGDQLDELLENRLSGSQFNCGLKTLSRVIKENNIEKIDLLKIDVEKGEVDVLNGIDQSDWSKIRQIVIEVHNIDGRLGAIVDMLEKRGFEVTFQQDEQLKTTDLYNLYARLKTVQPDREKGSSGSSNTQNQGNKAAWNSAGQLIEYLRNTLKGKLPVYMIPSFFELLDQLPVTPNGKVDKKALPQPR